ncbi:50S ribosomal protein L1 [Buchnera aphidicola (Nipponaphis monzeni)]|uniref:Large ribosomal subunit protein uL1 n=1 Tax=Buchnera aphidicola (Nipponaphis monzeni) TaxID=2495405 RepID=A0A455T9P5_9GAMM|nr:50S ribosomal protein L1 [Buchnera aphidicola]BBI01049.1 50S ribosomal protein L1 [Buchnera aphidicola (Nipponaphis monzeni)]
MKKISKRLQHIKKNINNKNYYTIDEAINVLKKYATAKFNESIDVAIQLGINPKKTEQNIRNSTILPHGIGRTIKIAVFTQGLNVEIAKQSGADFVGLENLLNDIKNKKIKFDIVMATPDAMSTVGKLGAVLGPKGLMPNPKIGTVTDNISKAIKNAKNGQIFYRTDKSGIIHVSIGKINFERYKIKENLYILLSSIKKNKSSQCKGTFFKKIILSTTMGLPISIDFASLTEIIN